MFQDLESDSSRHDCVIETVFMIILPMIEKLPMTIPSEMLVKHFSPFRPNDLGIQLLN